MDPDSLFLFKYLSRSKIEFCSMQNKNSKFKESLSKSLSKSSRLKEWILDENIVLVQILFLKLFTIIYIIAFSSLFVQIPGLFGKDGLLPIRNHLERIEKHFGSKKYNTLPTIFWASNEINNYIVQLFPSLRNFQPEDNVIHLLCLFNIFLGICVLFDHKCKLFTKFWTFFIMWGSYLSIFLVGQTFLSFDWDLLILETGFLAMFFVPTEKNRHFFIDQISVVTRELLRWLMFRYQFANGVVKLLHSGQVWQSLSAMDWYFESQPLPTPFSRLCHFLPEFTKKFGTANILFTELFLPFLLYAPFRTFRILSIVYQMLFQVIVLVTGNYGWLQFHIIVLYIPLLDDKFLLQYCPKWLAKCLGIANIKIYGAKNEEIKTKQNHHWIGIVAFVSVVFCIFMFYFPVKSFTTIFDMTSLRNTFLDQILLKISILMTIIFVIFNLARYSLKSNPSKKKVIASSLKNIFSLIFFSLVFLSSLYPFLTGTEANMNFLPIDQTFLKNFNEKIKSFHIANSYGTHQMMNRDGPRLELIIQGSYDNKDWYDYEFFYKPGNVTERCKYNIPHQPRLDWQMWLAVSSDLTHEPWMINMIGRLFSNSESVLTLIKYNPFEKNPPNYLRIKKYQYAFEAPGSSNQWKILNTTGEDYLSSTHRDDQALGNFLKASGFQLVSQQSYYKVHILQQMPIKEIVILFIFISFLFNYIKARSV